MHNFSGLMPFNVLQSMPLCSNCFELLWTALNCSKWTVRSISVLHHSCKHVPWCCELADSAGCSLCTWSNVESFGPNVTIWTNNFMRSQVRTSLGKWCPQSSRNKLSEMSHIVWCQWKSFRREYFESFFAGIQFRRDGAKDLQCRVRQADSSTNLS